MVVSIDTGLLGGQGGGTFEDAKVIQTVETVSTISRHGNRRLGGSKESHWVTVPPLRNLLRCGDELPALGQEQWGKTRGLLEEEEEERGERGGSLTVKREELVIRVEAVEKDLQRVQTRQAKKEGKTRTTREKEKIQEDANH